MRTQAARLALVFGAAALVAGTLVSIGERSAFDAMAFGDRAAASLAEPAVARFAADRITNAVLDHSPDLTAVRPLILGTAEGLVTTEAFQAVVRAGARSAHQAMYSEGARRVVLSIPDVGVLLGGLLERASPELAARIPAELEAVLGRFEGGGVSDVVVDLWRLRDSVRGAERALLLLGALLLILGIALDPDRERAFVGAGAALVGAGLAVALALPLGGELISRLSADPLASAALAGVFRTFLAEAADWGLFLGGLGVLCAAAASTLDDDGESLAWLGARLRALASTPRSVPARIVRGMALLLAGAVAIAAPQQLASAIVVALGAGAAFLGTRELFRLLLGAAQANPAALRAARGSRTLLRTVVAVGLLAALGQLWILSRNPAVVAAPTSISTCNGDVRLCARRVSEVSFAGAHNAMSNVDIADWMFPHHQADIPTQLRDGVRALLIDVHYGFPGAGRVKTDLDGPRPTREALEHALGREGVEAAERLRDTLVGVDGGTRGLYLCHGFCEVGAYPLEPTLAEVRDFLVQNPGEVLVIVVEDYVTPGDLATAFEASGLADHVFRGPAGLGGRDWPTLRELVVSGQQVIVFLESGAEGIPWLRGAFESIQETPYTFHQPSEFSCRPNRGGTAGTLFQINHWIETTPTPLPSNAEQVNARDVLLGRARACETERGMLPNILAVDFYRSGDLLGAVSELNGLTE